MLRILERSVRNGKGTKEFERIYISGGRIGTTIVVSPTELASVINAEFADIIQH